MSDRHVTGLAMWVPEKYIEGFIIGLSGKAPIMTTQTSVQETLAYFEEMQQELGSDNDLGWVTGYICGLEASGTLPDGGYEELMNWMRKQLK